MDEREWLAERFETLIRARSREITSANVFGEHRGWIALALRIPYASRG